MGLEEKGKVREGSHCMGRLAKRLCLVEVDREKGDDSQKARRGMKGERSLGWNFHQENFDKAR